MNQLASDSEPGRSAMPAGVPGSRVRAVNRAEVRRDGRFVLYWMTANRRLEWNFALDRALAWCRELGTPLVILEALRCDYPWATARSHRFVMDGMAQHAERLAGSLVTYYPYLESAAGAGRGLLASLSAPAAVVVADDHPGFFYPRMLLAAADAVRVRMEAVDDCGLVPLHVPERAFPTAHSFRRWLQGNLPGLLADRPRPRPLARLDLPRLASLPDEVVERWPLATAEELRSAATLTALPVDPSVTPVPTVPGGSASGRAAVRRFVGERLSRYDGERNRVDSEMTSGLSPYLHFGHVSAQDVFAQVARSESWSWARLSPRRDGSRAGWWGMSAGAEAFLDQLVTWRELGFNAAARQDRYGEWVSLPAWARDTLDAHRGDPRPHVYSAEQLETAETHDPLWNAAQRQLVTEGRIHNYLRMLWGKKILHWTASPEEALRVMIELNNRYALDGRDPNSISGIFWTLGRYDRPWGPERDVFGRIRYMSSRNTTRKMSVGAYVDRYSPSRGLWNA